MAAGQSATELPTNSSRSRQPTTLAVGYPTRMTRTAKRAASQGHKPAWFALRKASSREVPMDSKQFAKRPRPTPPFDE